MELQYTPMALPLIFSIIVAIIIIITAFPRRQIPGVSSFIWLMTCVIEWTFFYILEISVPDLQAKIVLTKLYFVGVAFVPFSWLIFSLEYSRISSNLLTRRVFFLLLGIPVVIVFLMWTNDYHHIMWTENVIRQSEGGPVVDFLAASAWGFWWIHTSYSYIFVLLGSFILVRQSIKGPAAFESQAAVMIIGACFPFVANLLYTFLLAKYLTGFDPTPFALAISGFFYAWGLFRFGLFDLLPVAGEVVLEGLEDGVMILDLADRVVYINPAYADYAKISSREAIGSTMQEMMTRWPELIEEFTNTKNSGAQQISIQFGKDDYSGRFEMRMSPLLDFRRRNVGRVFILRKVTSSAGTRALDLTSATARRKLLLMTMLVNGEVISVNEHFLGIFGYTRVEIIEKFSIKLWESGEQRTMVLRKARSEGIENMEIGLVAKSGQKIDVIVSAKSITINDETYLFFAMREKR